MSTSKALADFNAAVEGFRHCASLTNFARLRSAAGAYLGTTGHDGCCAGRCEVVPEPGALWVTDPDGTSKWVVPCSFYECDAYVDALIGGRCEKHQ